MNIRHYRNQQNVQTKAAGKLVMSLEEQYGKAKIQEAVAKAGVSALETDTSQDTESSDTAASTEESGHESAERTDQIGDNRTAETSTILITSGSSSANSSESD